MTFRYGLIFFGAMAVMGNHARAAAKISLEHDADLVNLQSNATKAIKAGESLELDPATSYEVVSSHRMPVFLVPIDTKDTLKVSAPTLSDPFQRLQQKEIGRVLGSLMSQITDIQSLLQRKRIDEAQTALAALKKDYPDVGYLDFVQASIFFLQGKKDEALALSEKALVGMPDYKEGQRFVEKLKKGN